MMSSFSLPFQQPPVPHPCASLVSQIWGGFLGLLEPVSRSEKITVALCRALKSVIKMLQKEFEPYLGKKRERGREREIAREGKEEREGERERDREQR
jgi:hypothetical protein